jgi:hypothetical protein
MQAGVWPLGIRSHSVFAIKDDLTEPLLCRTPLSHMYIPVSKLKQHYAVVIPGGITARWALSW